MKKIIFPAILILIIGGYLYNDKNKKINLAKQVCKEHFKTQDEKCLKDFFDYDYVLASKNANEQLPEYKLKVNKILKEIDNLNIGETDINPFEYTPISYDEINSISDQGRLKDKKIIISGDNRVGIFGSLCSNRSEYSLCLTQVAYDYENDKEIENSKEFSIINIDDFNQIKLIIDKLNKLYFKYYKLTVYGKIETFGILSHKIKADYLKIENISLKDYDYERALRTGLYKKEIKEFLKYYNDKFPKKGLQ